MLFHLRVLYIRNLQCFYRNLKTLKMLLFLYLSFVVKKDVPLGGYTPAKQFSRFYSLKYDET